MKNYIDGFVFPILKKYLNEYKSASEKIADVWREYGALAYYEFVGNDLTLEGTRSFVEITNLKEDEVVIFGWALFPTKEVRDLANNQVPKDPRMAELIKPITGDKALIFDSSRMIYGGFQSFIQIKNVIKE